MRVKRLEANVRPAAHTIRLTLMRTCWPGAPQSRVTIKQVEWHAARLHITVTDVHAATIAHGQRRGRTGTRARILGRIGLSLMALVLPLLATDRGCALLAGVVPRYLRRPVQPKALVSNGRPGPALPAGPA